jgi:CRISPR-associated protein Cas1
MPKDFLLSGKMLLAQTSAYQDKKKRVAIACQFVEGAHYNMTKNLQYYNRRGKDTEHLIDLMNGYASKISECLRAIHQTQLNPTISYLHTPGERRYSLALDIAEIFKPIIVDRTIFRVLNKKEIQEKHFDRQLNKCVLNESGKKIFVKAIEEKLTETFKHRALGRSVSFKHAIKLECYKLAKHLLGMETYKPFKMYW